ncbi:MAG: hypothetical protein ACFFAO_18910, partial [Candidatus Hermodarchaeota archaeon]
EPYKASYRAPSRRYSYQKDREMKRYLKQQKKQRRSAMRGYQPYSMEGGDTSGTNFIIIAIVVLSIVAIFLPLYLTLSLYGLSQFYVWTIFSSLFISYSGDILGLFFLFILIIFLYNISKTVETRFGTKFLVSLYIFCAAVTGAFYVLIRYLLSFAYPVNAENVVFIGLATGAILGLISFIVYFSPNREMMLLCFFIPVKMKGKTLITVLILFRLIPGLLFGLLITPLYFAVYLPDLGGIWASYLVFKTKLKRQF